MHRLKRNLCKCGCDEACYNKFVHGHAWKGKKRGPQSEEHIRKRTGPISKERRKKQSETMKIVMGTKEMRKRQSELKKGIKQSEETKLKRAIGQMKCRTDGYCHSWGDLEYKDDCRNDICNDCGMTVKESLEKWNEKLSLHHKDGKKENCRPDNFDTLCRSCHKVADWKLWRKENKSETGGIKI